MKDRSDFPPKLKTTKLLAYKGACQLACHGRYSQSKSEQTLQLFQSKKAHDPVAALLPPPRLQPQSSLVRIGELPERKPPPAKLMNFYYGFFFYSGTLRSRDILIGHFSFKKITRTLQTLGNALKTAAG